MTRVCLKVVTLDEDGYRRGFEEEAVIEDENDGWGVAMDMIDRAFDDPEGRRWEHEQRIADALSLLVTRKNTQTEEVRAHLASCQSPGGSCPMGCPCWCHRQ